MPAESMTSFPVTAPNCPFGDTIARQTGMSSPLYRQKTHFFRPPFPSRHDRAPCENRSPSGRSGARSATSAPTPPNSPGRTSASECRGGRVPRFLRRRSAVTPPTPRQRSGGVMKVPLRHRVFRLFSAVGGRWGMPPPIAFIAFIVLKTAAFYLQFRRIGGIVSQTESYRVKKRKGKKDDLCRPHGSRVRCRSLQ